MKMTNEQQLDDLGLKPYYYYLAHATVCVLVHDNKIYARGIAICSPKDQFIKSVGRAKALGRAIQALHHEHSLNPIKYRFPHLKALEEMFTSKSSLYPQPTSLEKNILKIS